MGYEGGWVDYSFLRLLIIGLLSKESVDSLNLSYIKRMNSFASVYVVLSEYLYKS